MLCVFTIGEKYWLFFMDKVKVVYFHIHAIDDEKSTWSIKLPVVESKVQYIISSKGERKNILNHTL